MPGAVADYRSRDMTYYSESTRVDIDMRQMAETVLSLYRQSQAKGETGRAFTVSSFNYLRNRIECMLVRTEDSVEAQRICAMATLGYHVYELTEDDLMALFMAEES
jgi:hypothetical protein